MKFAQQVVHFQENWPGNCTKTGRTSVNPGIGRWAMSRTLAIKPTRRLRLEAETAADLMTSNPVSVREDATVPEVTALLTDKGICAAPVIDDAGRPVGVVSQSDILIHERESAKCPEPVTAEGPGREADRMQVGEIMTPVVFSVGPETPAAKVVEELRSLRVRRLFVVDAAGVLVGVISTHDILRHCGNDAAGCVSGRLRACKLSASGVR
jgi:CBS domain-containing protein